MSITILTASDIDKLISDPATLEQAIASQRDILTAFSASSTLHSDEKDARAPSIQIPPRITVVSDDVTALCMPSRVKVLQRPDGTGTGIGVKVVSVPHEGGAGLPATTTLFDGQTGNLRAVVNSRNLTALRNACASALFIQSLPSISASATNLVLFGSGAQALYHARVLCGIVPTLRRITIVGRRETPRLQTLVTQLQQELPDITVQSIIHAPDSQGTGDSEELQATISKADIICTMTSSIIPLFTTPVKDPCALILIGSYKPHMQEVTAEVLAQARTHGRAVVVDCAEACLREAGELIRAGMGEADVKELGLVIRGADVGGEPEKGVYLFKSVGISIQDIAIADVMLRLAGERGVGTVIPGYD